MSASMYNLEEMAKLIANADLESIKKAAAQRFGCSEEEVGDLTMLEFLSEIYSTYMNEQYLKNEVKHLANELKNTKHPMRRRQLEAELSMAKARQKSKINPIARFTK